MKHCIIRCMAVVFLLSFGANTFAQVSKQQANKCDERMENYPKAIAWYENVLTNPETSFNDSIFAAIDLGNLYLKMEVGGEKSVGKMIQYKPKSESTLKRQTEYALSLLPKEKCYGYFMEDLEPVSRLLVNVGGNDTVFVDWGYPESSKPESEHSLSWSIGEMYDQIGGPCATCDWSVAHRYEEKDLDDLIGWRIKSISMIPWRSIDTYEIRIWEGSIENCTLVYSRIVEEPMLQQWNTIEIDEDICLERGKDYFMGYKAYAVGGYFLPIDDNYGVQGKGNLIELNPSQGWITNNDVGLPWGNYMISTTLEDPKGRTEDLGCVRNDMLTGYRIYRDGQLIREIPYSFVTYYTDTEFTKGIDVEYCVTAVYGDVESEPVCATAIITGVGENPKDNGFTLSPNPTSGIVRIEGITAAETMVCDVLGQLLKTAQNTNEIDLKGLPQGVYLLRVTDEKGATATRKVVVE